MTRYELRKRMGNWWDNLQAAVFSVITVSAFALGALKLQSIDRAQREEATRKYNNIMLRIADSDGDGRVTPKEERDCLSRIKEIYSRHGKPYAFVQDMDGLRMAPLKRRDDTPTGELVRLVADYELRSACASEREARKQ